MTTRVQFLVSYLQSHFNTDEKGTALVEYALIVALIAVASLFILGALGDGIAELFTDVNTEISNATP